MFWPGSKAFKIYPSVQSLHDMLRQRMVRNNSLITTWTAWNFTLSYSFQLVHFFQYRSLARCTQRAVKGRFLEVYVELTLKHWTIFDRKREIRQGKNRLLLKLTWSSFTSVPYWLVARHMKFPSLYKRMVAVFVVLTSTVEFRISVMYMGRVPLAVHDSIPPWIANRVAGNFTIGGTNW